MIAFEGLLVGPAREAGIEVPPDPEKYRPIDFVHFHVFCNVQLGAPIQSAETPLHNARVIAQLTADEARTITFKRLLDLGLSV